MQTKIKKGFNAMPESYKKVLEYFFSFPDMPIGLNELSGKIKASKTATTMGVGHFIGEGIIHREIVGNAWRLSVDQRNPLFIRRKIPYSLGLVLESEIITKAYQKVPQARAIILFGSYRWGSDNEKSDLDLAVEILGKEKLKIEELMALEKLGLRKNVKVNIHLFSRRAIELNLFTNIANGIILDGILEVHP